MKTFFLKHKYIFMLLLLTVVSHLEWFNPSSILFNYDFQLRNNEMLDGIFNGGWDTWIWFYNFGSQNIQLNTWPTTFFWGLIGDYSIATKLNMFIPIAVLSVLSPYFLIKYVTKSDFGAFVGALSYGFSTFILFRQLDHVTIAFVFSIFPLVFLYFHKLLVNKEGVLFNLVLFSILFSISIAYEIRISFIAGLLLFVYFLFNFSKLNLVKSVIVFVILLCLNSYWILPYTGFDYKTVTNLTSRPLFGNNLFSIINAFTVFDWHWTGSFIPFGFTSRFAPFYYFIHPILVIWGFIFLLKKNFLPRNFLIYLFFIVLVGILITKQVDEPFPNFYKFLFENIPGFSLFRETSKFYLVTGFAFSIIIGIYISFERNKFLRLTLGGLIIFISLVNVKPFLLQEAGDILTNQTIPNKYSNLINLIKSDSGKFKTLWIPFYSHFGYADIDKPKMSLWHLLNQEYAGTPYLKEFTGLSTGIGNFKNPDLYADIVSNTNLMRVAGVKYIIIPSGYKNENIEFPNNIFPYAGDREAYIERFDKIEGIEKVDITDLEDIVVYQVPTYDSLVFISEDDLKVNIGSKTTNLEYVRGQRNTISTVVHLDNTDIIMNMSQARNKNWTLGLLDSFPVGKKINSFDFMNSWIISKEELISQTSLIMEELRKEGYPKDMGNGKIDYKYYILNLDGSIDVKLVISFYSQKFFYIGLAILLVTIMGLFLYLIAHWKLRKI